MAGMCIASDHRLIWCSLFLLLHMTFLLLENEIWPDTYFQQGSLEVLNIKEERIEEELMVYSWGGMHVLSVEPEKFSFVLFYAMLVYFPIYIF